MSVPTHNLYEFIHHTLEKQFWVMYFNPWGERNLIKTSELQSNPMDYVTGIDETRQLVKQILPDRFINFTLIKTYQSFLFCHDQEPLNFDFYLDSSEYVKEKIELYKKELTYPIKNMNLKYAAASNLQKYWVLLHSEKNSPQLQRYEDTGDYIGAYWWSHAMISLDWFRYAEHDPMLNQVNYKKTFLIYCRDTTGSRTYRNTVLTQIDNIKEHCQVGSFDNNTVDSTASAIYNAEDFSKTMISLVLETVFDERIHLTEKTLRPIACGHPFILAAGPGSLDYIKSYGFKTFAPYIDESYDQEPNADKRLKLILNEVKRIANLPVSEKEKLINHCKDIAKHNKKLFFNEIFFKQIVNELKNNVYSALDKTNNEIDYKRMWEIRKLKKQLVPESLKSKDQLEIRPYVLSLIKHFKKGGTIENYVPPDLD